MSAEKEKIKIQLRKEDLAGNVSMDGGAMGKDVLGDWLENCQFRKN